jgi:hypothetical protein
VGETRGLSDAEDDSLAGQMSTDALVFVSCGQVTDAEKRLGRAIVDLINATPGLTAYFAQNETSFEGLSNNIFRNLNTAAGFIAVMHHRGTVQGREIDPLRTRASVWIEQEIGIAAFLTATGMRQIKVAAFIQRGIALEGVREKVALNPIEFDQDDEVLEQVKGILSTWKLKPLQPSGLSAAVDIGYVKKPESDGARHLYDLKVVLRNTGSQPIRTYNAAVAFPAMFIRPEVTIVGERLDAKTQTHRVFRSSKDRGEPILPGDEERLFPIPYQVNDKLYEQGRAGAFDQLVTVRVFVGDQPVVEASTPFGKLQQF